MSKITEIIAVLIVFSRVSAAMAAEPVIGNVVRSQGLCVGISDGASESLGSGATVHLMEKVSTGQASRLEIAFDDGTHLTIGEKAEVVLDAFVYAANGTNRFHAAITGAFRYASGKLSVGATREASITTPFAVIGVRGTNFWGGPIGGQGGVIVFEGIVSVSAAAGSVVLSAPGVGVDILTNAPPVVTQWPDDKVATAIATVAFQ